MEKLDKERERLRSIGAPDHVQDSDCEGHINPETDCCIVCGVDHSTVCILCGGRGFHAVTCFMFGE
jgi:hypothetical protein